MVAFWVVWVYHLGMLIDNYPETIELKNGDVVPFTKKMAKRFEDHIRVNHETECWEWTGVLHHGYGTFVIVHGNAIGPHVLAMYIKTGKLNLRNRYGDTRHICHNRACCNPDHLCFGTREQNIEDETSRGHTYARAKLTYEDAENIRKLYATGKYTQRDLAKMFHLKCHGTIGGVVRGESKISAGGPVASRLLFKGRKTHPDRRTRWSK